MMAQGGRNGAAALRRLAKKMMEDDVPRPPCLRGGVCEHYQRCAEKELACEAFVCYVQNVSGRRRREPSRVPSRKNFHRAMGGAD